ncbi:ABC transporter ATP-binding protein [Phaeocystidibacter luteus]|uniref:ATP-binding cassette domain-containing protein n=1 Tax=Phaeocystidibacter luteus TaxID=911197 RepID=A0A6N6RHE0_9FLAO|nr:ATP-binding cassette domain-containing protein [Phaeocystidibacter luteus]KAB2813705.1 ATP-binding cassette domain-containing protein [Phaeocystidibacter luteus]
MSVLTTTGLTKDYGRIRAVNKLDLDIPAGTVFGLLGPNGSGKTTTLGMVLGAIRPTEGDFHWFDGQTGSKARKRVGAILEYPVFYPHLSGAQNLKIAASIKQSGADRIEEVLDFVGLGKRGKDPFKAYSLGMKQRLAIASALVGDPEVLILDEPTNGLDPEGIHDIRDLITQIAESGKSIVLASHLLDEVQRVCKDYAVLKRGTCIHKGNVKEDLSGNGGWEISSSDLEKLAVSAREINFITEVEKQEDSLLIQVGDDVDGQTINRAFIDKQIVLGQISERRNTLEEKFLELLKSNQ